VKRDLLLALDLGTTRVCALLMDESGAVLARADRALSAGYPEPGWMEQDPVEMWESSIRVLREALARGDVPARRVAGLGVVTQRSTTVAWDAESGAPLAPAIGWQDQRTAEHVASLRARGIPITTLPSATKFQWWLERDGPVSDAAQRGTLCLGTPDVWLTSRLTGGESFATDPSCASCTGLMSLATGDWFPEALDLFGVPRGALPEIVPTARALAETPGDLLGAPIPVAARAGDQQAASFAQGTHAPGQSKLTLGTSAMLDLHTVGIASKPPAGTYPLALWRLPATGDHFCVEGTVITAGALIDWLVELGVLEQPSSLDGLAAEVPSSEGVAFVPALQGLGTPYMDEAARGLLGGLTRGTTTAHIARAAVDGVAQRCADVCEAMADMREAATEFGESAEPGSDVLPVDGGLAASDLLLQTLADLTGRPVERAGELETTAVGAALLAGLAVGILPDLAACRATRTAGVLFTPSLPESERRQSRARWAEVVARSRGTGLRTA
jgi:glycerol kinase